MGSGWCRRPNRIQCRTTAQPPLNHHSPSCPLSTTHPPLNRHSSATHVPLNRPRLQDGRVEGNLNLSRAIGDLLYKRNMEVSPSEQMITALPDIKSIDLSPENDFMVLACDGIWNVMTSQEVIDFVRVRLQANMPLGRICEEVCEECLAPDTNGDGAGCDNMTMMVVRFGTASEGVAASSTSASSSATSSSSSSFASASSAVASAASSSAAPVSVDEAAVGEKRPASPGAEQSARKLAVLSHPL